MLCPSDFEHGNDSPCPLFLTLSGDKQTIDGQGKTDAPDPSRHFAAPHNFGRNGGEAEIEPLTPSSAGVTINPNATWFNFSCRPVMPYFFAKNQCHNNAGRRPPSRHWQLDLRQSSAVQFERESVMQNRDESYRQSALNRRDVLVAGSALVAASALGATAAFDVTQARQRPRNRHSPSKKLAPSASTHIYISIH